MLRVGDVAPDFTAPGTGDRQYSLRDYKGQPVVLVFYPGDNTPVCTRQLNSYSSNVGGFNDLGAQLLALSPQSVESHEHFSCQQGGFGFPLLADEDKRIAKDYGVVGPLGFYRRCVFVIDAQGVVRYAHRAVTGVTFRPSEELLAAVRAATGVSD